LSDAPASSASAAPWAAVPAAPEVGARLTIDLAALTANWRRLAREAGGAVCAAVVKADAYGTGLEPAAKALWAAGCRVFFVAQLSEAETLRAACPDAAIYVLNGLLPGAAPAFARRNLRPVLGSRDEILEWAALSQAGGQRLPAALHVDTGMNRLGLPVAEALALAGDELLGAFEPALVMSHLVGAEEPDHPANARQIAAFLSVREAFAGIPASLANSSGIFLKSRPHFDLVRPGYALYGGNPTPGGANPMAPVVRLEARVIQLRSVEAGASAGYNGQWTATGPRRLATIALGYADGYPRGASGTDAKARAGRPAGEAVVAGRRCPFAGRVSMDLLTLDVTDVPEAALERGGWATLIGDGLELDEVGSRAGTIGYEILTGLGRRYARRHLGAEEIRPAQS
jgi:alanine racemase